jgi:site-specific DNA-adenine methylase
MIGGVVTPEKRKIASKYMDITEDQACRDFCKFMETTKFSPMSQIGLKFLNYFFFPYRLDTITKKKINFYDFLKRPDLVNKPYIQSLLAKRNDIYSVFRLYFGTVSSFKPHIAYELYEKYQPQRVLDFSAGWGGRMLGAIKYGCDYIGFDTNKDLKRPYQELIKAIRPETEAKIYFRDSAKVDYSKYDYDMVFTSPPYYKIEQYEFMPQYSSYEDWVERFLRPVISNSYQHLKSGGTYALNVPQDIYKDVVKILGRTADTKEELKIVKRQKGVIHYKEYIYVWKK